MKISFMMIFLICCYHSYAQVDLFLKVAEEQDSHLNNQDAKLVSLFWEERDYTVPYTEGRLFLGEYLYINNKSQRVNLEFKKCEEDLCLNIIEKKISCRFAKNKVHLTPSNEAFVMDSDKCRIKGNNFSKIKKVTSLIIFNKMTKKFHTTGSLLRRAK